MKTIFVQAVESDHKNETRPILVGKVVPIHADDNPNGGFTLLRHDDPPMEVRESHTIRRAIADGDLRVVDAPKPAPTTKPAPDAASAK